MLSEKLIMALNDQINYEMYSSYTYLAMSAYAESKDFGGFANFFKVQAQEELFHAMKLYDYVNQVEGKITLKTIEEPKLNYDNIYQVFKNGYEHEQSVTKRIYNLMDIAIEEKEHATISLLKWYIDEQVEEENTFRDLIKKLKRAENNQAFLFMLDEQLGARTYTPPTNTQ